MKLVCWEIYQANKRVFSDSPKSHISCHNSMKQLQMNKLCMLNQLFLLIQLGNLSYARKDVGDYWKSIMKDQPIPDSIRDLFHDQDLPSLPGSTKQDRFVRDFDVRPNLIIYHSGHSQPERENKKPSLHEFETKRHQELQEVIKQISRD